jgi:hypothetical protein
VTAAAPSAGWTRSGRGVRAALILIVGALGVAVVPAARANPAATVSEAGGELLPVTGTVAFMVVESDGGALRVSVIQRLATAPDHVILGGERDRLLFPLPEVAPRPRRVEAVDFVSGWRRPRVVNGVIVDGVPPLFAAGEMAYAFVFEPRGATATVRWILPYGANDVEMLLPERGIRASGAGLRGGGGVTERGRRYVRWSAGPVRPGDAISVRLDGLAASDGGWPEVTAGILAVALACGLVVALRRRSVPAQTGGERAA